MVLESTMICVDNSDYMRNGDFLPTRLQAQQDAVNLVCHSKTRSNPENNVGLLTLANVEVLATLTSDVGRILSKLHRVQPQGTINLLTGIRIAHLALKHRQGKNHKMRIVAFVGSPVETEEKELVKLAKRLKKEKVNVDIVSFGEEVSNNELLTAFVNALNGKDGAGSHLVSVPPGPHLSDALISSPVIQGEDGMGGAGLGGSGFEFGVDPNEDPELALGRLRSQFMKEIRLMKEKVKTAEESEHKAFDESLAALQIQKTWRGYNIRTKMKRRKLEEMLLIGMLQPNFTEVKEHRKAEEVKELRRKQQMEYQAEYEQMLIAEKQLIKAWRGGHMKEEIGEEVCSWITNYWHETGKFPDMPSEESGGSTLFFTKQAAESEISKTTTSSSREGKGKKEKGKKDKDEVKKKKDEEEEDPGFKMQPSNFLGDLQNASTEYEEVWRDRDESQNPWQHADVEMIRDQKMVEVEVELRREVDQLLRGELEILQAALARDLANKGKKMRKASKKKGRTGKKSKKKKEKDLTPDRTIESLFEELVTNGIIRKYPEVQLSEFRGERSYAAHDLRKQGKDPLPSLGDIRQVILEYCILPLGSKTIHQTAPLVKSVLLAGPHGSGKDMLVHAVCTETGSVLFDLSPANIVGKYPGKSGLIMLVHLVNKVSRLLQPSVIYIDGGEKPFLKKVPKTDKTDPKRLKKDLPKIVKSISQDDQVLLIGVSRSPWDCDQKALVQTYNKMILIPRPDYSSLSFLWKELLFQFGGVSRQFDTTAMTKVSDGYTVGAILEVIKEVMTCKRALQLRVQPLTHIELINSLCKLEPVYKEEEEAFLQWFLKTPIGRRKARQLEIEAELKAELAPKSKKK